MTAETGKPAPTTTRVVIADDQSTIRMGLRMILDNEPDIEVVGEAGDGEQAVAQARALVPDVVLMDIRMPRLDGIGATERLTAEHPGTRTLVLTTFGDDEYLYGALKAGAAGFMLKDCEPQELVDAVRRIGSGDGILDPAVTRKIIERFIDLSARVPATAPLPRTPLTERERDTVLAVAKGLSNKDIGLAHHVSEATVKTHIRSVLTKLNLENRVQLVVWAYESQLVRPGN